MYKVTFYGDSPYLEHHGVLGMKWGVRNAETTAKYASAKKASFKTKRLAKKDAKEFATAKMYYGEGAGTRRKLIKNRVEQRKKDRPGYSEEFEKRLDQTNWDKTVSKAKSQRAKNTAISKTKKTARGMTHIAAGNAAYASAGALALAGILKYSGVGDKLVSEIKRKGPDVVDRVKTAGSYGSVLIRNIIK